MEEWCFVVFHLIVGIAMVHQTTLPEMPKLLCEAGKSCHVEASTFPFRAQDPRTHEHMSMKELGAFTARYTKLAMSGQKRVVLAVGPGRIAHVELSLYKHMMQAAQKVEKQMRFVFVEPLRPAAPGIKKDMTDLGIPATVDVISAALCPVDAPNVTLHVVSDKLLKQHPVLQYEHGYDTVASLDEQHVEKHLKLFNKSMHLGNGSSGSLAGLHCEHILVRCLSPFKLFDEHGLQPEAVGMVIADAGGLDAELLRLMLALPGFQPELIVFRWLFAQNYKTLLSSLDDLAQKGYDIHKELHLVIAILREPPQRLDRE